jgi:hypothetical protein
MQAPATNKNYTKFSSNKHKHISQKQREFSTQFSSKNNNKNSSNNPQFINLKSQTHIGFHNQTSKHISNQFTTHTQTHAHKHTHAYTHTLTHTNTRTATQTAITTHQSSSKSNLQFVPTHKLFSQQEIYKENQFSYTHNTEKFTHGQNTHTHNTHTQQQQSLTVPNHHKLESHTSFFKRTFSKVAFFLTFRSRAYRFIFESFE